MQDLARKHHIVLIVPVYEVEQDGVYYNTAAVIDADGTLPRQVPQDAHPARRARASGRSSTSAPATSAIRSSTSASPRSASTSATTATSPKARAPWA